MKTFIKFNFDPKLCRRDLDEFKKLLDSRSTLDERRDIRHVSNFLENIRTLWKDGRGSLPIFHPSIPSFTTFRTSLRACTELAPELAKEQTGSSTHKACQEVSETCLDSRQIFCISFDELYKDLDSRLSNYGPLTELRSGHNSLGMWS